MSSKSSPSKDGKADNAFPPDKAKPPTETPDETMMHSKNKTNGLLYNKLIGWWHDNDSEFQTLRHNLQIINNHCLSVDDHDGSRHCEQVFVYAAGSHSIRELAAHTRQAIDNKFASLPKLLESFRDIVQQYFHPVLAAHGSAESVNVMHNSTPEVARPVGFNHDVEVSPNVLALLVCNVLDPQYSVIGPPVNHRSLEAKRIFTKSSDPDTAPTGIVSTLLNCGGLQQEKFDPTLCAMPYFIFPYRVREKSGKESKDDITLEFILAHDKNKPTKLLGESIGANDLCELVTLLYEGDYSPPETGPLLQCDTTKQLLHEVSQIMTTQFHNLRDVQDQQSFCRKLLLKAGWVLPDQDKLTTDILIHELFGTEYYNACCLLLQALTPVRLGFLDGQARMTSISYFARMLVPDPIAGVQPLIGLDATLDDKVRNDWSLNRTSCLAPCILHTNETTSAQDGKSSMLNSIVVDNAKHQSKARMDGYMQQKGQFESITPNKINDILETLIDTRDHLSSPKLPDLPTYIEQEFKRTLALLRTYDNNMSETMFRNISQINMQTFSDTESFVDFVFEKIHPTKKSFPSLQSQIKGGPPELVVLVLITSAALAKKTSALAFKKCLNKDWLVPITDPAQVNGVAVDSLSPKTCVFGTANPTEFLTDYYLPLIRSVTVWVIGYLLCQGDIHLQPPSTKFNSDTTVEEFVIKVMFNNKAIELSEFVMVLLYEVGDTTTNEVAFSDLRTKVINRLATVNKGKVYNALQNSFSTFTDVFLQVQKETTGPSAFDDDDYAPLSSIRPTKKPSSLVSTPAKVFPTAARKRDPDETDKDALEDSTDMSKDLYKEEDTKTPPRRGRKRPAHGPKGSIKLIPAKKPKRPKPKAPLTDPIPLTPKAKALKTRKSSSEPTVNDTLAAALTTPTASASTSVAATLPRSVATVKTPVTQSKTAPPATKTPLIPPFHFSMPPHHVDINTDCWYWDYADATQEGNLPFIITLEDVLRRIVRNLVAYIFTAVALQFAALKHISEAEGLFDVLTRPIFPSSVEELAKWHDYMNTLFLLCDRSTRLGGTINHDRLLEADADVDTTFADFFRKIIMENRLPFSVPSTTLPPMEAPEDFTFKHCWTRDSIVSVSALTRHKVHSRLHMWKVSIVFDSICRNVFQSWTSKKESLTEILLGANSVSPTTLPAWGARFHLVLSNLPNVQVLSPDDKILSTGRLKGVTFSQIMATYINQLWETAQANLLNPKRSSFLPRQYNRQLLSPLDADDKDAFADIYALFFTFDGKLRMDLKQNIYFGRHHGFVRFDGQETTDVRWEMPLHYVSPEQCGTTPACLFSRIVTTLSVMGLIDKSNESVVNISLVVGGTTIQPIHHNVSEPEDNASQYASIMESVYAPANLIFGFNHPVRLGVDAFHLTPPEFVDGKFECYLEEEPFEFVIESSVKEDPRGKPRTVYVLESSRGFIVRGDLSQAGVCSTSNSTEHYFTWRKVHKCLVPLLQDEEKIVKTEKEKIFDMLCGINKLDSLTRLCVQVSPKDFQFRKNTIGFYLDDDNTGVRS